MSGAGFLLGHDVAGEDTVEAGGAVRAGGAVEDRPHRRLGRGRGDRQLQPASWASAMIRVIPGRGGSRAAATISV